MPKILILFTGQPTTVVDAVANGARSIRFSEVEIRRVATPRDADAGADIHPTLAGADEMVPYDAIVVAASEGGSVHPALGELLAAAASGAPRSAWQDKVGSAFVARESHWADVWPALTTLGNMGMVVLAPSGAGTDAARALGARVAQVVGWVTHARSHHHHAH